MKKFSRKLIGRILNDVTSPKNGHEAPNKNCEPITSKEFVAFDIQNKPIITTVIPNKEALRMARMYYSEYSDEYRKIE